MKVHTSSVGTDGRFLRALGSRTRAEIRMNFLHKFGYDTISD